ncbi:MAG: AEC family transporter [Selenomonadaceae bacterium]
MEAAQLRILFVFTDLVLPLALGYYLHQKHIISGTLCNKLIHFNIIVICTILSILSFWALPLSLNLIWLPAFGFIFAFIPGGISALTFARRQKNLLDRGAYIMSSMLANIGTLGGLCAFILYGEIGFAYAQMVGTFQNILLVVFCFPLAQYYYQKHTATATRRMAHSRFDLRSMLFTWDQLSVLGMILGMVLHTLNVPRPQILANLFQWLVHIGAWTSLLPVGYLVDFSRARHYYQQVLDLVPLKFIIVPIIIYFMIKQLFDDQILLGTMMILAMTPSAINAVITARLFKLNVDLAIASFLLTTVLFLFLVFPLFFFYVQTGHTL